MARGNSRALIFLDRRDYVRFLEIFGMTVVRFGMVCLAFCLMPNHYHLVLKTPAANLSAAIKHLNGVYSQWWNHRHQRCGHTFQGRFKAQLIQRERYLAAACRYVVLNPVRADWCLNLTTGLGAAIALRLASCLRHRFLIRPA